MRKFEIFMALNQYSFSLSLLMVVKPILLLLIIDSMPYFKISFEEASFNNKHKVPRNCDENYAVWICNVLLGNTSSNIIY